MQSFSLLVRVQSPHPVLFQRMLASLQAQSNNTWELVLVTDLAGQPEVAALIQGQPHVRLEVRPDGESLAQSCNALLGTLGDWIGFLGQHDQLLPEALTEFTGAISAAPQAKVVYSDEASLGRWGQLSLPTAKGVPDPVRLLSADYLRDLALIQNSWLTASGGFDRLASDQPRHDLYLRTLESLGAAGFAYIPQCLFHRYRNRLTEIDGDPRHKPYLPQYDLDSVRRHFERLGIPVKVKQLSGSLDIAMAPEERRSVSALLVLGDDLDEGKARLASMQGSPVYPLTRVQVLFTGQSPTASARLAALCEGFRYGFKPVVGTLPAALNQEILNADTDLALLLQGIPLGSDWLKQLMALTRLPGVQAASGTLITPTRQVDGGPWDTRGHLNQLAVPHSASLLGSACLLTDTRRFLELGGFDSTYPTLFAEDFTLRLSQAGDGCAVTPRVHVQVGESTVADPAELDLFRAAWAGWEDPHGIHQLP